METDRADPPSNVQMLLVERAGFGDDLVDVLHIIVERHVVGPFKNRRLRVLPNRLSMR